MKTILIVDDDPSILDVMRIILEEKGYSIEVLEKGLDALSRIEKEKPDLVFLDNWLPDITGEEVIKKLKRNSATRSIPTVIISANHDITRIAKESGADDSLPKPFELEELIKVLEKYC